MPESAPINLWEAARSWLLYHLKSFTIKKKPSGSILENISSCELSFLLTFDVCGAAKRYSQWIQETGSTWVRWVSACDCKRQQRWPDWRPPIARLPESLPLNKPEVFNSYCIDYYWMQILGLTFHGWRSTPQVREVCPVHMSQEKRGRGNYVVSQSWKLGRKIVLDEWQKKHLKFLKTKKKWNKGLFSESTEYSVSAWKFSILF